MSVAELLISAAMDDETADAVALRRQQMRQLLGLQRDLAKVAVNVNQVARIANTFHKVPSTADETFAELRRVAQRIEDAIGRIGDAP